MPPRSARRSSWPPGCEDRPAGAAPTARPRRSDPPTLIPGSATTVMSCGSYATTLAMRSQRDSECHGSAPNLRQRACRANRGEGNSVRFAFADDLRNLGGVGRRRNHRGGPRFESARRANAIIANERRDLVCNLGGVSHELSSDRDLASRRGDFDARARARNHLAGIRALERVEDAPQLRHHQQIVG